MDFGRKIGLFLGVLAAAGITYGGWRANEEETVASTPVASPTAGLTPERALSGAHSPSLARKSERRVLRTRASDDAARRRDRRSGQRP